MLLQLISDQFARDHRETLVALGSLTIIVVWRMALRMEARGKQRRLLAEQRQRMLALEARKSQHPLD